MSKAFKCDRCGKLYEKGETWIDERFAVLDVKEKVPRDLCISCYKSLEDWLSIKSVESASVTDNSLSRSVHDCKYLLPFISGENIMYYGYCLCKYTDFCYGLCDHAQFTHLDKKEVADERDNL